MTGFILFVGVLLQTHPGDAHHQKALDELARGDGAAAEASAREAILRSQQFRPEEEIGARPDKGLLFDEMILEARRSYRARRARYFLTLGDVLAAQKKWREARKSYRRSNAIEPNAAIPVLMAGHPDLAIDERLDLMLDAYLATPPGERSPLEAALLETGSFRTRNALKAALDRRRFGLLQAEYKELELLETPLPDFQAVTNAGTLIPPRLFQAGFVLIIYVPVESCERCSEELDGITVPVLDARKRGRLVEVAAFVPERDLEVARRIARLLALAVGVGRKEGLPPTLRFAEEGEIRLVAHGGITQIRLPLASTLSTPEIRRRVEAVLAFLEAPGLPTEAEPEDASVPIVRPPRPARGGSDSRALFDAVDVVEKLEAGPAPLDEFYQELSRLTQRTLGDGGREIGFQVLERLSRLRGANVAKTRALSAVAERWGEQILSRAQSLDPLVKRTPAGETGALHLAVAGSSPRRLYLQRSLETDAGLRTVEVIFEEAGAELSIVWAALQDREPLGVRSVDRGAAFFHACAEGTGGACRGARLVDGPTVVFEGEPATAIEGRVYRVEGALVDAPGPSFHRPVDAESQESALAKALTLYSVGDYAGALAAFEKAAAEIDPYAPYDASDILYNRARSLEELGKRREALEIYRSLGDVSYQVLVDERARLIESGR